MFCDSSDRKTYCNSLHAYTDVSETPDSLTLTASLEAAPSQSLHSSVAEAYNVAGFFLVGYVRTSTLQETSNSRAGQAHRRHNLNFATWGPDPFGRATSCAAWTLNIRWNSEWRLVREHPSPQGL